jgi:hypothetical protein
LHPSRTTESDLLSATAEAKAGAFAYALNQAERAAKMARLFDRPRRTKDEMKSALDPKYDLMALREQEKPQT